MGQKVCGSKAMDAVEDCICNKVLKPSLVTPSRIEKIVGLDHNVASACLDIIAPHPGESSVYELCEETGQGRWLIKSASKPNEYWVDERDECVIQAIKTADGLAQLTPKEREDKARTIVNACPRNSSGSGWLKAFARVVGITALATSPIWVPALINRLAPKPKNQHKGSRPIYYWVGMQIVCCYNKLEIRRGAGTSCPTCGNIHILTEGGKLVTYVPSIATADSGSSSNLCEAK